MDFSALIEIIKAVEKEVIMELVKSKWIRFSLGAAILMVSSQGFIRVVAEAIK